MNAIYQFIYNKKQRKEEDLTVYLPRFHRKRLCADIPVNSENVKHRKTNKILGIDIKCQSLGTQSYFCNPYHSWEKGTVENAIGLIRRFLPKKTDFATVNPQQIKQIESLLNNSPRPV